MDDKPIIILTILETVKSAMFPRFDRDGKLEILQFVTDLIASMMCDIKQPCHIRMNVPEEQDIGPIEVSAANDIRLFSLLWFRNFNIATKEVSPEGTEVWEHTVDYKRDLNSPELLRALVFESIMWQEPLLAHPRELKKALSSKKFYPVLTCIPNPGSVKLLSNLVNLPPKENKYPADVSHGNSLRKARQLQLEKTDIFERLTRKRT